PGRVCPSGRYRAISPGAIARNCHKMLLDFLRTVLGANGIERASTPPGSLELRHRPAAIFRWRIPRGTLLQLLHRGTSMSIFGILSSGFLQKQLGAPSTP